MDKKTEQMPERPDRFWYKVYRAVVLTTVVVIAAIWSFSLYFR